MTEQVQYGLPIEETPIVFDRESAALFEKIHLIFL